MEAGGAGGTDFRESDTVAMKRIEQDDQAPTTGSTPDATAVEFQAMRLATHPTPGHDEAHAGEDRFTLFYRVFGGTILSIVALAAVTVYNGLSNNISEVRAELNRVNNDLRGEVARANEARADLVRKDEFNTRQTTVWDGIKTIQAQNLAQTTAVSSQRGDQEAMKERVAKVAADFDAFRKESTLAAEAVKKDTALITDTLKKDVAALDTLKDKLTALATDMKLTRDDIGRMRTELDRNEVHDNDRKESRDKQYKVFDDTTRELLKAVQDCREKIARLEGQTTPMPTPRPATPPKGD